MNTIQLPANRIAPYGYAMLCDVIDTVIPSYECTVERYDTDIGIVYTPVYG